MKLRKQFKNRVVAVALLAVMVISNVSVSFASVDKDVFNSWFSSGSYNYSGDLSGNMSGKRVEWKLEGADPIYLTEYKTADNPFSIYEFYSKSDFTCDYKVYEGDKYLYGYSCDVRANSCKMFGRVYNYSPNKDFIASGMHRTVVDLDAYKKWRDSGAVEYCKNENIQVHLESTVVNGGLSEVGENSEWISLDGEGLPGSQDDPIKKDDFGYPDIYNSNYLYVSPSSGGESDKLSTGQYFEWNRKSTTGFNLTKNDYNYTYIECKVKNCFQYNDNFSGKGDWHRYDSYGEMGSLGKVRAESLSHYYTFNELMTALPKLESEMSQHIFKAMKSSYVFYFRIVCMKTSSTVVIPNPSDCTYYCGPWRSVDVSTTNGNDHKSVIEDGDFDDEGNWKKDDTSTDNGKDIDSGTSGGKDFDDAIDNSKNDNSSKSDLDLDSAKEFINQIADVPKMIGDIFSFFPDWVKYCFALGFAFIPILIIFKLIRG